MEHAGHGVASLGSAIGDQARCCGKGAFNGDPGPSTATRDISSSRTIGRADTGPHGAPVLGLAPYLGLGHGTRPRIPMTQPAEPAAIQRRPLFTGASLSAASQVATAATGALVSVVLARLLGPAGLGDYNLLLSLVVVLLAVGTIGLDFGLSYAVARNEWSPRDALAQTQFVGLMLGLCALAVGVVMYHATQKTVFSSIDEAEILLALACLPFALTTQLAGALALAIDRYEIAALVPSLQSGLTLVLTAILAPLLGLKGALAGFLAAYLLSALVLFIVNVRGVGPPTSDWLSATWPRCRSAIRFGFGLSLTSALWLVIQRLDLFLLSAFVSSAVLGQYALAFSITTAQLLLPRALGQVLLPRIARLGAASEADQRAVTMKSLRHGVLLVTLTALVMAALLPLTPLVFGDQFGATVPLAEVLVPGVAAAGLISVMSPALAGHGRPRLVTRLGILGLLIAGLFYGVLIPLFEAWGAAIASSVAYLLIAATYATALHRYGVVQKPSDWRPSREELHDYRDLSRALVRRIRSV